MAKRTQRKNKQRLKYDEKKKLDFQGATQSSFELKDETDVTFDVSFDGPNFYLWLVDADGLYHRILDSTNCEPGKHGQVSATHRINAGVYTIDSSPVKTLDVSFEVPV